MRDIFLHGELGRLFINKITLDVNSIGEVISALKANFSSFSTYLVDYKPGFHVRVGSYTRTVDNLTDPISSKDTIHIIPVIAGSGKVGTIIAGVVLIWATGGLASLGMGAGLTGTGGALAAGGTTFGIANATVVSALGQIGVGLVLTGISALLFSPPKQQTPNQVENTPNRYFNGAVNTVSQGNPVSIGYGRLIIGSAVISAGITVDNT